jgi:hypothetical protein
MSGLIWAGIGKGISDAATSYGGYMMRANEEAAKAAREEARDARKLAAEETKAEALKQRVIREIAEAQTRGEQIGISREAGQVGAAGAQVAGDSPVMDKAEIEALIRENPQYREIYRSVGIVKDAMDPRAQRAFDESQAGKEIGAHSSVMDALDKQRKAVLDQIKEENRDKRDTARDAERQRQFDTSEERRNSQFIASLGVRQQNADANTTRAEREPVNSSTRAPSEAEITAAENALASVKDRIGKTFRDPTMQEKYNADLMSKYSQERNQYVENHPDVKRQSERVNTLYTGQRTSSQAPAPSRTPPPPAPKTSDNTKTTRPPLQSFIVK